MFLGTVAVDTEEAIFAHVYISFGVEIIQGIIEVSLLNPQAPTPIMNGRYRSFPAWDIRRSEPLLIGSLLLRAGRRDL